MSYPGETGETSAVYRHKDAIPVLKLGTTTARFVAPGSLTGERYGLFRWDMHGFRNNEAASMLILFAPGPPRERYFEELAAIIESGRQLSDEEWTELYARHDQYMV